jgi:hypothetical protein
MKKKVILESDDLEKKVGQKITKGLGFLKTGLETKKLTKEKALQLFQELLHAMYNTGVIHKQHIMNIVRDLPNQKPKPGITKGDIQELYEILNIIKEAREEEEQAKSAEAEPKAKPEPKAEPKPKPEPKAKAEPEPEAEPEEVPDANELVTALLSTSIGKKFSRYVNNMQNTEKADIIMNLVKSLPGTNSSTVKDILRKGFSN